MRLESADITIGYNIPIPPKADLDAWQRLHITLREAKRRLATSDDKERVALTHELERQLARLQLRPAAPGRTLSIRNLERRWIV